MFQQKKKPMSIYVKKVLEGSSEEYEITLNATSVNVIKDLTIADILIGMMNHLKIQHNLRDF